MCLIYLTFVSQLPIVQIVLFFNLLFMHESMWNRDITAHPVSFGVDDRYDLEREDHCWSSTTLLI